jgi:guanosine-diphosphatase
MSSGVDVRQRPGIWSYFGFNSNTSTTRNRRTSSVSLPTRNVDDSDQRQGERYSRTSHSARYNRLNEERSMHPRQRIRYIKAGGFLALVILILFFLTPGEREKVEKYVGGL